MLCNLTKSADALAKLRDLTDSVWGKLSEFEITRHTQHSIAPTKLILNSNLAKSRSLITPISVAYRFDILHRARQWYCRALCKISKRLDNWEIRYRQTRFQFKMSYGGIQTYTAQAPQVTVLGIGRSVIQGKTHSGTPGVESSLSNAYSWPRLHIQ